MRLLLLLGLLPSSVCVYESYESFFFVFYVIYVICVICVICVIYVIYAYVNVFLSFSEMREAYLESSLSVWRAEHYSALQVSWL